MDISDSVKARESKEEMYMKCRYIECIYAADLVCLCVTSISSH